MKKILFTLLLFLPSFAFTQNFILKNQAQTQSINPVSLFVKGNKQELINFAKSNNGKYKYSYKGYHNITIPQYALKNLIAQPNIERIDYALNKVSFLNDSMRVKARINQVQTGLAPLPQGYSGKNVLIGFVDNGIDFRHPDFMFPDSSTRVIAIWDQTQPFDTIRTPGKYGYGQLWDSTDINAGICTSVDPSGHGTTVAGTSAGNGFSTGTHWGAAPNGIVAMVKTDESVPNWSATVADAVDYLFYLADSLGLPCVINASVGDYYGSHDGRDIPAQYIDSLLNAKRGRLMVAGLGNSGTLPPYHLETNVDADTSFTWFKYNAPGGGDAFPYGVVYFEVFADSSQFSNVQFSVGADQVSPSYKHRTQAPFHNVSEFIGGFLTDTLFSQLGDVIGIVDYYAEYQGDLTFMQIHMREPDSNAYYFRFSTTGSGRFDVWTGEWLGISDMINTGVPSVGVFPDIVNYVSPDSAKIMCSGFQCLESVIAVANYNNIQNYIGYDLSSVVLGGIEGDIANTSSRGPTRDNRQKPELAATGNVTFSPGPLDVLATYIALAPQKLLPDGWHMRNGGTSMASPVVAGVGALLLERCPLMRWDEFKNHISTSAYTDSFTGAVPNISWGYGKVSAYDAMLQTLFTTTASGGGMFCEGNTVNLTAPGGMSGYLWSNGDTTNAISTDTTLSGWLIAYNTEGCPSDTANFSVVVNPNPSVSLTVNFDSLGANTSTGIVFQWYMNGAPISGANNNYYNVTANGDYYVEVTDANGCSSLSDSATFTTLETVNFNSPAFAVYPNPFDNTINIQCNDVYTVKVSDVTGKNIFSGSNSKCIGTEKWESGVYVITVTVSTTTKRMKMVKK